MPLGCLCIAMNEQMDSHVYYVIYKSRMICQMKQPKFWKPVYRTASRIPPPEPPMSTTPRPPPPPAPVNPPPDHCLDHYPTTSEPLTLPSPRPLLPHYPLDLHPYNPLDLHHPLYPPATGHPPVPGPPPNLITWSYRIPFGRQLCRNIFDNFQKYLENMFFLSWTDKPVQSIL